MINAPVLVCKTYVEFLYPGIMVSETSSKEVKSRDISEIEIPGGAYALKFYDIEYNEVNIDNKVFKDETKRCRETGWQYLGGEVLSLADVKKKMPTEKILISNMEGNKIKKVVKTKFGQCMPMEKNDCVI
jgi:pantothenate kinase